MPSKSPLQALLLKLRLRTSAAAPASSVCADAGNGALTAAIAIATAPAWRQAWPAASNACARNKARSRILVRHDIDPASCGATFSLTRPTNHLERLFRQLHRTVNGPPIDRLERGSRVRQHGRKGNGTCRHTITMRRKR